MQTEYYTQERKAGLWEYLIKQRRGSLPISSDAIILEGKLMEVKRDFFVRYRGGRSIDNLLSREPFFALVDSSYFEQAATDRPHTDDLERMRLSNDLWDAFDAEPLEDGIDHPAEQIIEKALQSPNPQSVLDWLRGYSLDAAHPSFAASVLRCLGRQDHPGTLSWRIELVQDGLAMENVEMRDAAAQAAESWGDRDMVDVLESHLEREPWLQEYIQDIIGDLQA